MERREVVKRNEMDVFSYRIVGDEEGKQRRQGGGMYSWGAGGGEQGGSWDSPGKGEPQWAPVMHYALIRVPKREVSGLRNR